MPDQILTRNTGQAITRGTLGRCPKCGEGKIFAGYLATAPACAACGEDFSQLRTADGPAFFTMSIVGLLLIPALWLGFIYLPDPLTLAVTVSGSILVLTLILLRLVKGGWLGLEWAHRH
ncbi:DUF983 domain-containing protein [Ketogulonicigenium vulgare]|uniref:DUF983 domain-containing protein n=1 Tax=Ketogulonicigenium vulgare TaxID=92945 RepID=UPI002358F919|nr:DUF983 domain-containing protein [Ketogulonicigenium vulgare]